MDRDAARARPVVLASTRNMTTPAPVPEAPLTTVSQLSLLVALHAQPLDVVTVTFPVPPAAANDWPDSESEKVHDCACEPVVPLDTETLALVTETQGGTDPASIRAAATHGATST